MKKVLLFGISMVIGASSFSQIYIGKVCEISFFSKTTVENIDAVNKSTTPLLNIATGDIQMKSAMTGFVFEKPLMQEHFNENYVESEKFPYAIFKGKINEKIDYTKDGDYKVTVTGKLKIHGVEKDRTIDGIVSVKGGVISISSNFKIKFADHNVEIPTLYALIIPEDTDVKISATFEPYKKK
ncbi:MAG: YceI family protein [Bacteroidetes bacterium]|nr:YceI family protein [Bacteroidota bacterium]